MKYVSHIILSTLLVSGTALAAETINFDKSDANNDGKLSSSEWNDVGSIDIGFEQIDQDGDRMVDRQEVQAAGLQLQDSRSMQGVSHGNKQGNKGFQQADSNRDNRVSEQEARDAGYDYVVFYYEPMDVDSDGYLDENEWNLSSLEAGYIESNFAELDTNNDGAVSEDEADIGWLDDNDEGLFDDDDL
ncbi:MAG TPA: hypothetical protein VF267_07855 [Gammaproteobacteria bacterium]